MKLGSKAQDNKYANVPGHRPRAVHTQRECKRVSIGFRRFRARVAARSVCAFCTPKGIHFGVHVFLLLPNPLPFSRALCFPLPKPFEPRAQCLRNGVFDNSRTKQKTTGTTWRNRCNCSVCVCRTTHGRYLSCNKIYDSRKNLSSSLQKVGMQRRLCTIAIDTMQFANGSLAILAPFASTHCIAKKTVRNGISHAMENGKHSSDNVFRRAAVKVSIQKKQHKQTNPFKYLNLPHS